MRAALPGRSRSLGGVSYGAPRGGGLAGADGQLPEYYRNAGKEALLFWAESLDRAVQAIHEGDLEHVHDILANVEESYDVSETGNFEGGLFDSLLGHGRANRASWAAATYVGRARPTQDARAASWSQDRVSELS